jgi:hypothetical protein
MKVILLGGREGAIIGSKKEKFNKSLKLFLR